MVWLIKTGKREQRQNKKNKYSIVLYFTIILFHFHAFFYFFCDPKKRRKRRRRKKKRLAGYLDGWTSKQKWTFISDWAVILDENIAENYAVTSNYIPLFIFCHSVQNENAAWASVFIRQRARKLLETKTSLTTTHTGPHKKNPNPVKSSKN